MDLRIRGGIFFLIIFGFPLSGSGRVYGESFSQPNTPNATATLETMVRRHFAIRPQFRTERLLTQSEVRSLIEQFRGLGIVVPGQNGILRRVPGEQEIIARLLLPYLNPAPQAPVRPPAERTYAIFEQLSRDERGLATLRTWQAEGRLFTAAALDPAPLVPPLEWGLVADAEAKLANQTANQGERIYTVETLIEALVQER